MLRRVQCAPDRSCYCQGVVTYPSNVADGVADVLAGILDRQNPGRVRAVRPTRSLAAFGRSADVQ